MKKQTIQNPKNSVPLDSIPRLAYTPAEAGAAIGRDKSWVYRQIYTGNLRVSASFGKRAMIPAAELERFVNTLGNYEVRNIGRRAHRKTLAKQITAKLIRSKNIFAIIQVGLKRDFGAIRPSIRASDGPY